MGRVFVYDIQVTWVIVPYVQIGRLFEYLVVPLVDVVGDIDQTALVSGKAEPSETILGSSGVKPVSVHWPQGLAFPPWRDVQVASFDRTS